MTTASESEELSTDARPAGPDSIPAGLEEPVPSRGNGEPHPADPAISDSELERLLDAALDADDKRLWKQTINVGLARSDLEEHLRSCIDELASEDQLDVAGEDIDSAGRLIAWADIAGEELEHGGAAQPRLEAAVGLRHRVGAALQLERSTCPWRGS